jgi:hypothetical protein
MNDAYDRGKKLGGCQDSGVPEQDREWQPPRLTVWEVARDTSMGLAVEKTGSGADSHGMRDVTPTT